MAKADIGVTLEEKIGLPNYSNIVVRAYITKKDVDYETDADLKVVLDETAVLTEEFLAEYRASALKLVQG